LTLQIEYSQEKFIFRIERINKLSLGIPLHLSYNQVDIDKLQKEIKQLNHQIDTDAFQKSKEIQTINNIIFFSIRLQRPENIGTNESSFQLSKIDLSFVE
jgi:uncharacterized coiled-coil DUF342 family protein